MYKKIICLTPIKNEAWILETFLKCTSLWADNIILADQGSTDNSLTIANTFEKVIIVNNESSEYNEINRQKLLIDFARKKFGPDNILIALDADEILVNFHNNPEWENIKNLEAGTAIFFPWLNVLPGNKTYFNSAGEKQLFAYIDDGKDHTGSIIHSPRVPFDNKTKSLYLKSIRVLHFQFSVRERQWSKHRWYECLEKVKFPDKDDISLYRMYHHIDLPINNILPIPKSWREFFDQNKIDITLIQDDGFHWWDKEVCLLFEQFGVKKFKKQYIWYVDWKAAYKKYFPNKDDKLIYDPRSPLDKIVHKWLKNSQENPYSTGNRLINKFLRAIKW